MFYKNQVIELISNFYFEKYECKKNLLYLVKQKLFEKFHIKNQIGNYPILMKNYFEILKHDLFKSNIFNLYRSIFQKALEMKLIRYLEFKYFLIKILNLIDDRYTNIIDSDFKTYAVLSLLNSFREGLPRVALHKLFFTLTTREIFIKTIIKYDEIYSKKKDIYYSQSFFLPQPISTANWKGPYDKNLEVLIKKLENIKIIKTIYSKNMKLAVITNKGLNFLNAKREDNNYINDLLEDSMELVIRFKGWSGNRIQNFLKTYIIDDFSKYSKGDVLLY